MTLIAPVITIDGPSGVGKGTLCRAMARHLKWHILDSGAIYRVLALAALSKHIDLNFETALVSLAINLDVRFFLSKNNLITLLDGEKVSCKIHTQVIANISSRIATLPRVRKVLLYRQRAFNKNPGLIADGRDMGTVVFPDAPVKIFLEASQRERVNRRMLQLQKNGFNVNFEHLFCEMKERDNRDRNRAIAPLLPAEDALVLDSTNLNIRQVIKKALQYTYHKLKII